MLLSIFRLVASVRPSQTHQKVGIWKMIKKVKKTIFSCKDLKIRIIPVEMPPKNLNKENMFLIHIVKI